MRHGFPTEFSKLDFGDSGPFTAAIHNLEISYKIGIMIRENQVLAVAEVK